VERFLPQVLPFSILELLSSFDQMILFFVTFRVGGKIKNDSSIATNVRSSLWSVLLDTSLTTVRIRVRNLNEFLVRLLMWWCTRWLLQSCGVQRLSVLWVYWMKMRLSSWESHFGLGDSQNRLGRTEYSWKYSLV
jgi:hypothetical protein